MNKRWYVRNLILFLGSCLLGWGAHAQSGTKTEQVKLLNADILRYDESSGTTARKLIGNVRFKHKATLMFCDSAYLFSDSNMLYAYGSVKANRGDSLYLEGDSMKYYGNTQLAELRSNVFLKDTNRTLQTNYLDFDMQENRAYYLGGGILTDLRDSSVLTSDIGYYYTARKTYYFRDSVKLVSPDYRIESDTLEYHAEQQRSFFHGPTTITSDSSSIFCERGWFDQDDSLSEFRCNARIQKGSRIVAGDSIRYDQRTGEAEAFWDVSIQDTANNMIVFGDYGYYREADSSSLVTGNVLYIQAFREDSLFLHADTLLAGLDSTGQHNLIRAFHKVQFFKTDLQGKCDSLTLGEADSLIRMFHDPIIWSDANQMTGDLITIKSYDGILDQMNIYDRAFIISQEAPDKYNQIKGRLLTAYFRDNDLYKIRVKGNGQTIYYGKEDNGDIMGMNRLDCSDMLIFIDSNEINNIRFYIQPDATLYPLKDLTQELKFFRYFSWRNRERPIRQEDIFEWKPKTEGMGLEEPEPISPKKENPEKASDSSVSTEEQLPEEVIQEEKEE